jgi:dTDP-glucose pyrophosphorylase
MFMSSTPIEKAVILARGLGTRMRRQDDAAALSSDQAAIADQGLKAMIPIGRPFLDYVLGGLADAGYRQVCLVIGPEHQQVRDYYAKLRPRRLTVSFAVQQQPKGTADAVAAAEEFAGSDSVIIINSDNYYPVEALRMLRVDCPGSGLIGFSRQGLLAGNIAAERIEKFSLVQTDPANRMVRIIEKPTPQQIAALGAAARISMNCWRFSPAIFSACRAIKPSSRGELELPDAVLWAIAQGETFTMLPCDEPVLDMSSRGDIASIKAHLGDMKVDL